MNNRQSTTSRRAFTLTELLIVIGLIVLLIAMAVPAFNFITGSRSVETARNKISAMLGRARSEAAARGANVGVLFFRDTVRDVVGMQLIQLGSATGSGAEAYQAWTLGVDYHAASGAIAADRVYALVLDISETSVPGGKYVVRTYECLSNHTSTAANAPVLAGVTGIWGVVPPSAIDALADTGIEYLPGGVGCQLINDPSRTVGGIFDRYVQTGVIAFDEQGKLIMTDFTISSTSSIGSGFGLPSSGLSGKTGAGVMLFDQESLAGSLGTQFSYGDNTVGFPGLAGPTTAADETVEETKIGEVSLHLVVDRYTGNLIRVE